MNRYAAALLLVLVVAGLVGSMRIGVRRPGAASRETGAGSADQGVKMATIKDVSRVNYTTKDEVPTWQEVRDGALLRIADAVEKMAQRHTELIRERDYYERLASSRAEDVRRLERSNAALRGVIARMKRAQVAPSKE